MLLKDIFFPPESCTSVVSQLMPFPMGYATAMGKGTGSGVVCPASRSKSINPSMFRGKVKTVEPLPDLQLHHLSY